MMTPDQEDAVCDALVALSPAETDLTLIAEGLLAIMDTLGCPEKQAGIFLNDTCQRGMIQLELTPRGGELERRGHIPIARLRWSRPVRS